MVYSVLAIGGGLTYGIAVPARGGYVWYIVC